MPYNMGFSFLPLTRCSLQGSKEKRPCSSMLSQLLDQTHGSCRPLRAVLQQVKECNSKLTAPALQPVFQTEVIKVLLCSIFLVLNTHCQIDMFVKFSVAAWPFDFLS